MPDASRDARFPRLLLAEGPQPSQHEDLDNGWVVGHDVNPCNSSTQKIE